MDQVQEVVAGNRYPGRRVLWARTLSGGMPGSVPRAEPGRLADAVIRAASR